MLALESISHGFAGSPVLDDFDLTLHPAEIIALVGQSGCGKTTLLRIIAGLIRPDSGRVQLAGHDITDHPAEKRGVGLVFQDYALFPHMSVRKNILYGLHRCPRQERQERIAEVAQLARIDDLLDRFPHQLSGGQQQRVALARALAPKPSVLLLDEPFSNLDPDLRQQLREELRRILKAAGMPAILVTHDRQDAQVVADRTVPVPGQSPQ